MARKSTRRKTKRQQPTGPTIRPEIIGFVLGAPTGLSGKAFLNDEHALDVDLAYDFVHPGLAVTCDYLYHFSDVLGSDVGTLRPYLGGGGAMGFLKKGHAGVAGRATGGLSFRFRDVPVELLIDLSPGLWLIPRTAFYFGGVLGVRYVF